MANPLDAFVDPWVVVFGPETTYVFGPFEGPADADDFQREHGGQSWPLLGVQEQDVLDGEPWLDKAKRANPSPNIGTVA